MRLSILLFFYSRLAPLLPRHAGEATPRRQLIIVSLRPRAKSSSSLVTHQSTVTRFAMVRTMRREELMILLCVMVEANGLEGGCSEDRPRSSLWSRVYNDRRVTPYVGPKLDFDRVLAGLRDLHLPILHHLSAMSLTSCRDHSLREPSALDFF